MRSDLEQRLRDVHRSGADGQDDHRRAHEDEVMAAYARRGPTPAPRRLGVPRLALAGALTAAVAVGACALPAEYPVSLGYGLEITVDAAAWGSLEPESIARRVGSFPGAERVELRVGHSIDTTVDAEGHEHTDEQIQLQIFVFGGAMDTDAMWHQLQDEFPELADAEVHDVPLAGTVHGTLGGMLSHDLLDMTIDRHGVEEAERRIMEELIARGIDPDNATIDIRDETDADGHRRIEVRVEAEQER